jgi:predicted DCC family thiol-disulfide oxidoreductase YuxK
MISHKDGDGWELNVSTMLFGMPLVSYSGDLRLTDLEKELPHFHHIVLFDGVCSMCNHSVDFVIARDKREPPLFKFAAIQSAEGQQLLEGVDGAQKYSNLNGTGDDSVLLLRADGRLLTHSDAALQIGKELGAPWSLLAAIAFILPRPIRDACYRTVGEARYRLFGKREACRLPTSDERRRFL